MSEKQKHTPNNAAPIATIIVYSSTIG